MSLANIRGRLNKDGTISTQRVGGKPHTLSEVYHWLVTMSWARFSGLLMCFYLIISLAFAIAYFVFDFENFKGIANEGIKGFGQLFLFSAQTLSTVGSVGVTPEGFVGNLLLTIESMVALIFMTLMTGLLYARFSTQPTSFIFSEKALIAPFKNGHALMIRMANERRRGCAFVDMEAELYFSWYDNAQSNKRSIEPLILEMKKVAFMPVSWTVVHPLDKHSPFEKYDLAKIDYEILIRIKGVDSITGQSVFSGHAYSKTDLEWNARFAPCSKVKEDGMTLVFLDKIGSYEKLSPAY